MTVNCNPLDRTAEILTPFPPSKNRPRSGGWTCPSCGFSKFQRRTACFRCSFPAMSAGPSGDSMRGYGGVLCSRKPLILVRLSRSFSGQTANTQPAQEAMVKYPMEKDIAMYIKKTVRFPFPPLPPLQHHNLTLSLLLIPIYSPLAFPSYLPIFRLV